MFATYVTKPQISAFFGVEPDNSGLKAIQGNLTMLMVFLGDTLTCPGHNDRSQRTARHTAAEPELRADVGGSR